MRKIALGVSLCLAGMSNLAVACDLPHPTEAVTLTISGALTKCTVEGQVQFDNPLFAKLPRAKILTTNPWDPGAVEYEGAKLTDVLQYVGATGKTITVNALNDYHADIPVADIDKYGVLLADRRAGQPMPVAEKGPYFVIFPFDAYPELKTEERYGQSVWQVGEIIVKP